MDSSRGAEAPVGNNMILALSKKLYSAVQAFTPVERSASRVVFICMDDEFEASDAYRKYSGTTSTVIVTNWEEARRYIVAYAESADDWANGISPEEVGKRIDDYIRHGSSRERHFDH